MSNSVVSFVVCAFIVVHGLVHLLYFAQSRRLVELQPGMVWPADSWAFSTLLVEGGTRFLASIACVVAAVGFAVGGTAIFARQAWWRPVVVGAAGFSAAVVVLFWDGKLQRLSDQGGIALLINRAILAAVLILRWPDFGL
jgi:CHASE2 domain-containing sensor protein